MPYAPAHAFRAGRLTVDLPEPTAFAPSAGGGTHDDVQLAERPWSATLPNDGPERDAAREGAWAERVERALHADPPESLRGTPEGDAGTFAGTREADPGLLPWTRAVLRRDPTFDFLVRWEVVADVGPLALVAQGPASEEAADDALQRYLDVIGAYVLPGVPHYGEADWLYLRYGAVARAPAGREVVRATFEDHPAFDNLSVATVSRAEPHREPSLVERWREAQAIGLRETLGSILSPGADARAQEVRVGDRPAGDFEGEEVVWEARVGSGGDADIVVLRFEWEHRGTPGDGHDPDISVTATARTREPQPSADEVTAALAAWDALLVSVRRPDRPTVVAGPPAGPYGTHRINPPPLPVPAGARGPEGWLDVSLPWRRTGNPLYPYDARVDGTRFRIGTGDFPAEDMFSLYVDGVPVTSFNDWPTVWRRP